MRKAIIGLIGAWLTVVAAAGLGLLPALADGDRETAEEQDHDRARGAVERGDILPLATILEAIRPSIDGEIVGIELEREDGRWIYEIKVIDRRGRMLEIDADARTAKRLEDED